MKRVLLVKDECALSETIPQAYGALFIIRCMIFFQHARSIVRPVYSENTNAVA